MHSVASRKGEGVVVVVGGGQVWEEEQERKELKKSVSDWGRQLKQMLLGGGSAGEREGRKTGLRREKGPLSPIPGSVD